MNNSTNTPDTNSMHGLIQCPPWCDLTEEQHLSELTDPREEISAHKHTAVLLELSDGRTVDAMAAKNIPLEAGDDESLEIWPSGLPDTLSVHEARELGRRLQELANLVGGQQETARFTWRDLLAVTPYRDTLVPDELGRDDSWFDRDPELADDVRTGGDAVGALLCWSETQNRSVGHLIMLTGQTAEQERITLANACSMVSQGVVYASREGRDEHKERTHDYRVEVDGESVMVWLIGNDERWS